jgi:hypothetical protein
VKKLASEHRIIPLDAWPDEGAFRRSVLMKD